MNYIVKCGVVVLPLLCRRLCTISLGSSSGTQGLTWRRRGLGGGVARQLSVRAVLCASNPTNSDTTITAIVDSTEKVEWTSDVVQGVADGTVPSQAGEVASAGLGGYTPVGLVQTGLELLHLHTHLPWWLTIAAVTVALRVAMIPLVVILQINAAKLANIQPELQEITQKILQYKEAGNQVMLAQEAVKMTALYQAHNCHPFKMFLMPLFQAPVFISFFIALRKMATAPIPSMTTGGTFWFTDLTIPDPTYALPLIACAAFISNIELGGETSPGKPNQTYQNVKMFLRVAAIAVLPLSVNFPCAVFMYWVTNSVLTTAQILVLRIPSVKMALGIPKVTRQ